MIDRFRTWLGATLITCGVAVIPSQVRKLVRDILMFHVPGALTEVEKRGVIESMKDSGV
jgi:hypothetical protein